MKRVATGLCGILAVNKPVGVSSHDVVNRVRRLTGERRVGHAGTLDPAASGVLLVGVGPAARLANYLVGHDKRYVATIKFGESTNTDDAEGEVIFRGSRVPGEAEIRAAVEALPGVHRQVPPAFSAIKKNGVCAYKAARSGQALELEAREIEVYSAHVLGVHENLCEVELHVSRGTYIRSIARDLGEALGCGAHLAALQRTAIGAVTLADCMELEGEIRWSDAVGLLGFPVRELNDDELARVRNGQPLAGEGAGFVSLTHNGQLHAIYEGAAGTLKPACILATPAASESASAAAPEVVAGQTPQTSLAIGVFDGVHLGHRELLNAAAKCGRLVIVTFAQDPDEFFCPERTAHLLSNADRLALLQATFPAAEILALPATLETFSKPAEQFLNELGELFHPAHIFVGEDFRFGAKNAGNVQTIAQWGATRGCTCHPYPLVEHGGQPVCATRIRGLLRQGEVEQAFELLNRPHFVAGTVEHGRGEGTQLGFATANITPAPGAAILPREGVYAGRAHIGTSTYPAAINVGPAASFANATSQLEAHILGFEGDLYNQEIRVAFLKFLRPQRKFENMEELTQTVLHDIETTREVAARGN